MNGWRETQASALDDQANELEAALERLDVAVDVLDTRGRDQACTELRAAGALLRLEQNTIRSEASQLRVDPDRTPGLPLALTSRYPRGRRNDHHPVPEPAATSDDG